MATGEYSVGAGEGIDAVGKVETRGIDFIPEVERRSKPVDLAWAFASVQFCYTIILFGSFPLVFGLGWWHSVACITAGLAIGSVLIGLMSVSGPTTGTNQSVTSGAFFGIRGRLIGSGIAVLIDVGFLAIIAWTTAQAFLAGFHRYFGTSTGNGALAIGMAVTCAGMILLGWLGHATIVASYKFVAITSGILMIAMFAVFAPHFHAVGDGKYLLGSFWPTWFLSLTVVASIPIGYSTWPNDYGRYMRSSTKPRTLALSSSLGMFAGCMFGLLLGAFLQTTFIDQNATFVDGIFRRSPAWFLVFLMIYGFTGNVVNGALGVYNSALDLQALLFFLKRSVVALIIGAITLAVAYIGVIALNAINTIDAFVVIMTVIITAWAVVNIIGFADRKLRFYREDLHLFAVPGGRGRYWFTGGFNLRAVIAMAAGVAVGLLFSTTTIFSGPFASSVNGVDISWSSAGALAGLLYIISLKLFPEKGVIPSDEELAAGVQTPLVFAPEVGAQAGTTVEAN